MKSYFTSAKSTSFNNDVISQLPDGMSVITKLSQDCQRHECYNIHIPQSLSVCCETVLFHFHHFKRPFGLCLEGKTSLEPVT